MSVFVAPWVQVCSNVNALNFICDRCSLSISPRGTECDDSGGNIFPYSKWHRLNQEVEKTTTTNKLDKHPRFCGSDASGRSGTSFGAFVDRTESKKNHSWWVLVKISAEGERHIGFIMRSALDSLSYERSFLTAGSAGLRYYVVVAAVLGLNVESHNLIRQSKDNV